MKHRTLCFALAMLVTLTSTAFAGFTRINAPNPDDPMDVHIYKLDNGLMVYLTANQEEPRFYSEIVVRAGSKHDPSESTGLAHYLEHLLFKGTQNYGTLNYKKEKPHLDRITKLYEDHFKEKDPEKRKAIYAQINAESQLAAQYAIPGELDKMYKSMGQTYLNAHTWHEETVYKIDLPANQFKNWVTIETERFQNPVFRLFQPELEVVYEEKNGSLDSKRTRIWEVVNAHLFQKHPYGQQTTIGKVEHLKNPSIKNMYEFYNTYYVPNNMAICISGDIDIDETIETIDQNFSAWKAKELPKPKKWKEKPLKTVIRDTVIFKAEEYVLIAFRTAPRNSKDAEALKLLDMILDNSTSGLINLNLVQKQQVQGAGSSPRLHNDHGIQTLWGIPKKDQTLQEVEQLLLSQIEHIKMGQFDDSILKAIVTDFKKNLKSGLESNRSRVGNLSNSFLAFSDWDHTVSEIARMEKVTKQDIITVAKKYFSEGYVVGYRIDGQQELPKIEKPELAKIDIDPTRQSEFTKKLLSTPVEPIAPIFVTDKDYEIVEVQKDVKLYYAQNPINDLFSLTISVDIGTYQDNRLGTAKDLMNKSGAGNLTAEDLKKTWYALGTDFNIGVEDHRTDITISGLDENLGASLSLLQNHIKHPTATQETLDKLVSITRNKRDEEKKDPRELRDALRQYSRYGDNSMYKRRISNEALKKLTVSDLYNLISSLTTYQHNILYVGTTPIDDVVALIKKHLAIPETLKETPPNDYLKAQTVAQNEIRFVHKEMAQAQIFIEFGDVLYDTALRPATDLYNDYFAGGMSGIVFQELREARALAYSTFARYEMGDRAGDQNIMWGYIGCQADKTPEAISAFIDLIDNLPETPERFDETKNSVINRYRVSKIKFRTVLPVLRIWETRGLSPDPRQERFEAIQKADMNTMLNFHKQHVQSRAKLISILGDSTKIDKTKLLSTGKLMTIPIGELFVD